MGYQHISEANDGGEALRLLSKNQFDLVIIDWSLPSVSGVAITRWMRLKDTYRETPIIMVTTKDQPEDVLIAVESGVNEYVLKPLDKDILKTKINKAMGKRHMPT
jgi:two-component system chemotaxis response regulator CheY